ncbi:hypothetical protein DKT74_30515 [Streptomyces sp. ZEA17I]|nr:hypothetical protein DKT74_30515 [Streptomyces sp. ZEA17I]
MVVGHGLSLSRLSSLPLPSGREGEAGGRPRGVAGRSPVHRAGAGPSGAAPVRRRCSASGRSSGAGRPAAASSWHRCRSCRRS